jgi:Arabinose-binding domain of AraC transcription regulator, N-term
MMPRPQSFSHYYSQCYLQGVVRLTGSRPTQSIDYEQYFGCPVHFEQTTNQLCFDVSYLFCPIICNEADIVSGDMIHDYPDWQGILGREESMSRQVGHVPRAIETDTITNQ